MAAKPYFLFVLVLRFCVSKVIVHDPDKILASTGSKFDFNETNIHIFIRKSGRIHKR
jgi:hypothetical protein